MRHHLTARATRVTSAIQNRPSATAAVTGLVIAAATLLTGCDDAAFADPGPTTTENRSVDGVHAVDLRTSGDLVIRSGATPSLTVTAGRTTLRYLTATLEGGTVVLGSRPGHNASGDIHYELTLPTLDGVVVAGSGSARGTVVADGSFAVIVSGSGSADLDGLTASTVTAQLSGSGDLHLAGTAAAQAVQLAGSGSYLGIELTSQTSDVQVDGSGSAQVSATERLDARISGSGDVIYAGSPALTTQVSGDGTISAG